MHVRTSRLTCAYVEKETGGLKRLTERERRFVPGVVHKTDVLTDKIFKKGRGVAKKHQN